MNIGVRAGALACDQTRTGCLAVAAFVVIALWACLGSTAKGADYTAADYLTRGIQFANKGNLDMAIRHYNKALRRDPKLLRGPLDQPGENAASGKVLQTVG